jgi:hypothetical protein
MADAVAYGLGVVDGDAVDPCTRAWLELLRAESPAFRSTEGKSWIKGGTESATLRGSIRDVCRASSVYCSIRARDEIESRLTAAAQGQTSLAADPAGQSVFSKSKAVLDDLPTELPPATVPRSPPDCCEFSRSLSSGGPTKRNVSVPHMTYSRRHYQTLDCRSRTCA